MNKVFLDCETTGLDYDLNEVVELAWAVEDGPVKTIIPNHSLKNMHPKAMQINGYFKRGLDKVPRATAEQIDEFLADVQGATLVGANPRFDARMIVNCFELREEPWHYRLLDISAWAAGKLNAPLPLGMRELFERMERLGFSVPEPDHTAAGDVESTRAIYRLLSGFRLQED